MIYFMITQTFLIFFALCATIYIVCCELDDFEDYQERALAEEEEIREIMLKWMGSDHDRYEDEAEGQP